MYWLVNWLEYFPNTYLHSFLYFLGHNVCGMDLPEDQPLYVLQTLDYGSHCCDLLDHVVGCPLLLWTVTLLKASFFTFKVVFLVYSLFLVSVGEDFPFFCIIFIFLLIQMFMT